MHAVLLTTALFTGAAAVAGPAIIDRFAGPDGGYDYISVDSAAQRVFVARENGVMAIDLATRRVIPTLIAGENVSAVLIIPGTDFMLSTNYESNSATLFNRKTGASKARIPTGTEPDSAVYDPSSQLAFVMNGESKDVTFIDIAKAAVAGTVPVGGKPEAAATDGKGRLYVNVEDTAEIVAIDIGARKVVARYALPGCKEPTGLAYDAESKLLVSACANGTAKLIEAAGGKDRGGVQIGLEADGAIFDAGRRQVYIPCDDGTLSVFRLERDGRPGPVSTVKTEKGARTAALDPTTGRVYLPYAAYTQKSGKEIQVPKSFGVVVIAP